MEAHAEGKSYRQIAEQGVVSKCTAKCNMDLWKKMDLHVPPPHPGHAENYPSVMNAGLVPLSAQKPDATLPEIMADWRLNISLRTIG